MIGVSGGTADRAVDSRDAIARVCGLLAPAIVLSSILLATVVSTEFSWTHSALSDLGVEGTAPALLFNGGLIVGGVVGLPYALSLRRRGGSLLSGLFAATVVAMALVGVFPLGHGLHLPVAIGFYLLATATMAADGIDRRRRRGGRVSLLGVGVHLLIWSGWFAGIRPGPGLALPELAGAVVFAGWIWFLSPAGSR